MAENEGLILAHYALSGTAEAQGTMLVSLTPSTCVAGATDVALAVEGRNLASGDVVVFNDVDLATTFVDDSHLTATIPAAQVAAAGNYDVHLRGAEDYLSNAGVFAVTAAYDEYRPDRSVVDRVVDRTVDRTVDQSRVDVLQKSPTKGVR